MPFGSNIAAVAVPHDLAIYGVSGAKETRTLIIFLGAAPAVKKGIKTSSPPPQRNNKTRHIAFCPLTKAVNRRIFSAISKGALYFSG